MIDKFARMRERQEDWPDYAQIEKLCKLTFTEHAETRIGANIRLVRLHRDCMHDHDTIDRAERTIGQLERQLAHQLAVEQQRAELAKWRLLS